jgi:hypothetical protein
MAQLPSIGQSEMAASSPAWPGSSPEPSSSAIRLLSLSAVTGNRISESLFRHSPDSSFPRNGQTQDARPARQREYAPCPSASTASRTPQRLPPRASLTLPRRLSAKRAASQAAKPTNSRSTMAARILRSRSPQLKQTPKECPFANLLRQLSLVSHGRNPPPSSLSRSAFHSSHPGFFRFPLLIERVKRMILSPFG